MRYDAKLKAARLAVVRERLSGATVEIGTAGFGKVLARFLLDADCGEVVGDELVIGGMPKRAQATLGGHGVEARCRDAGGVICVDQLSVGDEASDSDVIVYPDNDIKNGQTVELMGLRFVHG